MARLRGSNAREVTDVAPGVQHYSLAPKSRQRFTKEEIARLPIRVNALRRSGRVSNCYQASRVLAGEFDRSPESIRWQIKSRELWGPAPMQLPIAGVRPRRDTFFGNGRKRRSR